MRPDYVFLTIMGFIVLWFLFQVVRNRGFRGAMFGAPVVGDLGEVDFGRRGLMHSKARIYALERRDDGAPEVGLEFRTTAYIGFHVNGFSLTREQARALSVLLSRAADEPGRAT